MIRWLAAILLLALPAAAEEVGTLRILRPGAQTVVGEMIPVTIRGEYNQRMSLESLEVPASQPMTGCSLRVMTGTRNGSGAG